MNEYYIKQFTNRTRCSAAEIFMLVLRWACAAVAFSGFCYVMAVSQKGYPVIDNAFGDLLLKATTGFATLLSTAFSIVGTTRKIRSYKHAKAEQIELYCDRMIHRTIGDGCVEEQEISLNEITDVFSISNIGNGQNAVIICTGNDRLTVQGFDDPDNVAFALNLYRHDFAA